MKHFLTLSVLSLALSPVAPLITDRPVPPAVIAGPEADADLAIKNAPAQQSDGTIVTLGVPSGTKAVVLLYNGKRIVINLDQTFFIGNIKL